MKALNLTNDSITIHHKDSLINAKGQSAQIIAIGIAVTLILIGIAALSKS